MPDASGLALQAWRTEYPEMHRLYRQKVAAFISQSTAPKWHEFFALIDELTRLVSLQYPAAEQYYKDFMLKFVYQEMSLSAFQSDFAALVAHEPLLYNHFTGFLKANISSCTQQDAVRQYFYALTGLPGSNVSLIPRPTLEDVSKFNSRVQDRFKDRPGQARDYVRLSLRRWRDEKSSSARSQLIELLADETDLLQFFERLWPEHSGKL